jgi:translin
MKKIEKSLDEKDVVREKALKSCREIIRKSRDSIASLHRGEIENAEELVKGAIVENFNLVDLVKKHPDIFSAGYMENAFQELVEACCLLAIATNDDLPDPDRLKVSYPSYLLGIGDLIGELRRSSLDSLKKGEIERAEENLHKMEGFYDALMKFDYPSAIVPIRKKRDFARNLIERTRGELSIARSNKELENKIEEMKKAIKKFEIKKEKGKKERKGKERKRRIWIGRGFGLEVIFLKNDFCILLPQFSQCCLSLCESVVLVY